MYFTLLQANTATFYKKCKNVSVLQPKIKINKNVSVEICGLVTAQPTAQSIFGYTRILLTFLQIYTHTPSSPCVYTECTVCACSLTLTEWPDKWCGETLPGSPRSCRGW